MYIEKPGQSRMQNKYRPEIRREELEAPHDMLVASHSKDVLLAWRAPEFEVLERDRKWYLYTALILLVIVSYAIWTNSLVMAITFILIGVVGYIYVEKEPRVLDFMITEDGVAAGKEIYDFENLKSFWIFYEPGGLKAISLHTKSYLLPFVHIPIPNQDPVKVREILLDHLGEEKHEPGMAEVLDRLLRL
jgi:hypothetical protein